MKAPAGSLRNLDKNRIYSIVNPVLSVLLAFLLAGLLVAVSGGDPISAYGAIIKGAFGSKSAIESTIRYALPLLLLGIAFTLSNKSGYFNIGQEAQMYTSALTIVTVQVLLGDKVSTPVLLILMILCGMIAGALISFIPAYLKVKIGANEIVLCILLNSIVLSLSDFLLQNTALGQPGANTSMSVYFIPTIPKSVLLIASIVLVAAYAFIVKKMVPGYRLRMVGDNPTFAKYCGLNNKRIVFGAALLSGVLASLTSTGELLGVHKSFYHNYADGMGFTAMTAALIGNQSVGGTIFGALLLGALQSGSIGLSASKGASPEIVILVRGFVMLLGTISILQLFVGKRRNKKTGGAK